MANDPLGELVNKVPARDWLVSFLYTTYCQGTTDRNIGTALVRNVKTFEQACNRVRIVAQDRGWYDPWSFEDMTVDLDLP
jgi:hypothetical protein